MNFRILLRLVIAASIGFGIGMAAQAKGLAPAQAQTHVISPADGR